MQIRFASLLPWWIVISIALFGGLIIFVWYLRESKQISGVGGWLLAMLRGLAFLLMIVMLLRPSIEYGWTDGELSRVRIIVDSSKSMQTIDEPSQANPDVLVSRINAVSQGLLSKSAGGTSLVDRLAQEHHVELIDFEGRLIRDSDLSRTFSLEETLQAEQLSTPLGEVLLAQVRERTSGNNLNDAPRPLERDVDAVVLISDGQGNGVIDPMEILDQNSNVSFPIYTVTVGQSREPVDLGILATNVSAKVRKEDSLRGLIRIKEECPIGTKYSVQIKNAGVVVFEEELVALGQGIRDYRFDFPAMESFELANGKVGGDDGSRRAIPIDLQCEIVAVSNINELTLTNNTRIMSTWGVTRENRILILDPRGRWETRYIRNALERDPNWELESRLGLMEFEGRSILDSKEALASFDLVILTNEAANSFDDEQSQWLADFVSKTGGGLIWIDSSRSNIELTETWRTILPFREDEASEIVHYSGKQDIKGSLRLGTIAEDEPALQLISNPSANTTGTTNGGVWERLAGPRAALVRKLKPSSEVLVEFRATSERSNSSQPSEQWYPFMTTSRFGQGRVIAFASDESWRWRYEVADLYHQRFWNQISNWCMRPPFTVSDDFLALDAGNRVYSPNDSVVVRTKLLDDDRRPSENGNVKAVFSQNGLTMARIDMKEQVSLGGIYQGVWQDLDSLSAFSSFDPNQEVTVSIEASGVPLEALKTTTSFRIDPEMDIESSKLACNIPLLESIAKKTNAACVQLSSLDKLEELLSIHKRGVRRVERFSLAESYVWLTLIMTTLAIEWILRKRFGLV